MTGPAHRREAALRAEVDETRTRLAAVGSLHAAGPVGLCSECMTPHPCTTARLVAGEGGPEDTTGDSSHDEK